MNIGVAATVPDTPEGWTAAARTDVLAAAEAIGKRHVGAVAGHPAVTVPLQQGVAAAQADAAQVRSAQDYKRLMSRFINGFGDPHTGIDLQLRTTGWTGLAIDFVDGRYRVVWRETSWPTPLPPLGAEVQSCDGVWTGTYLQNQVAPYAGYGNEYASAASHAARQSMFERGLGWAPKRCTFVTAEGARNFDLPLLAVPEQVPMARVTAARAAYNAVARPVGVEALAGKRYWVGMPSFEVGDGGKAYDALYARLKTLRGAEWVIVDLRGNGGGSTDWGQRALDALYGETYAAQLVAAGGYAKYMIADQATIELARQAARDPNLAGVKAEIERMIPLLERAADAGGKVALVEGDDTEEAALRAARRLPAPRGPRIAAVIDRHCFSSCMNVLQRIRAISGAVVLGEATLGYSPYGEIGPATLPSGLATLYLPTAWFLTATAQREPFVPDMVFPGNIAQDNALTPWVMAQLDRLGRLKGK